MLNGNSGNNGRRLKTVTRKQTLTFCEIKATSSQRKVFVHHKLKQKIETAHSGEAFYCC